jgi:putative ABC transport system permease protein
MSPLRRLWNLVRRSRMDDDLREELDIHLTLIEEEARAGGATAEEARRIAQARFGSALVYREQAVDAVVPMRVERMLKEIRFASRRLMRSPAFTFATVLTLALAIGANVAVFTVVQRVVLNPLPYGDASRLIALEYGVPRRNIPSGIGFMSWQLYWHLVDRARTLDGVAVCDAGEATLASAGVPERIRVSRATPSLTRVLDTSPALGRWFSEEEGTPGAEPVAVLSHGLWSRRYGRDRGIVGRTLTIDGVPATVVGVMPASFAYPDARVDVWMAARSSRAAASFLFTVAGVARLRPGTSIADARTEMTSLIADLARTSPNQAGLVSAAIPLQDALVGPIANTLWILLGSVVLVLLVACANVANLFLVRADAKQRETAVRRALGAGRSGIAHYFLAESALLSLTGGVLGLALAWGGVRVLVVTAPIQLPRLEEVRFDAVVIAFTIAIVALTAVVFGLIPLLRAGAITTALHDGGRATTVSAARQHARHVLMAAQIALALVLLVSSGLMMRSLQKLREVDPGFDASSSLTFSVGLADREYPTRRAAVAAHQAILDRLTRLPGLTAVSTSTCLPLDGTCYGNGLIVERPRSDDAVLLRPFVWWRAIGGGYLEAAGIRLLRGRTIDRGDVDRQEAIVVVNKALADAYFPNGDPIGERIRPSTPPTSRNPIPPWLTIVGVVANTPIATLAEMTPQPQIYMPMSIAGGPDIAAERLIGPSVATMSYLLRSAMPAAALTAAAGEAVGAVNPNLALARVRTLQQALDRSAAQMAFTMALIAVAAAVAVLLGIVGIYGVVTYVVSQRTNEIGVRLALGADPRRVSAMIVRQSGLVVLAGMLVGLAAAFATSRLLATLLYGVSPRDPGVFAMTLLLLFTVAIGAVWFPARRAARISPLEALRAE